MDGNKRVKPEDRLGRSKMFETVRRERNKGKRDDGIVPVERLPVERRLRDAGLPMEEVRRRMVPFEFVIKQLRAERKVIDRAENDE
jgi:hypothetical protein